MSDLHHFFRGVLTAAVIAGFAAMMAGCVSASKSRTQARQAFFAGQRAAAAQAQQQQQQLQSTPAGGTTVTVVGEVKNPIIGWVEGLTLSRVIVYAGYNGSTDPAAIVIHRAGQEIDFDPKRLLTGEDFPLEAGDVIEIRQ